MRNLKDNQLSRIGANENESYLLSLLFQRTAQKVGKPGKTAYCHLAKKNTHKERVDSLKD